MARPPGGVKDRRGRVGSARLARARNLVERKRPRLGYRPGGGSHATEDPSVTVDLVLYAVDGPIGIVTINRGDKLNAISPELKKRLMERLHEADRDPATRVVGLRAEGRAISPDDAQCGEPEIRFSNVGPALVMPFIIGFKRAREILYLGDPIDAQTALAYGMVSGVVPPAELHAATLKFARRMALMSPEALMATKLAINRGADAAGFRIPIRGGLDVLAGLYAARTEVGTKFDEIREKEGLGAALRWRAEQFKE